MDMQLNSLDLDALDVTGIELAEGDAIGSLATDSAHTEVGASCAPYGCHCYFSLT
ncbi:hypothetical protein AB0F71_17025 [Kitasatospora sp. NPDC028055]|uniref:hypothetical protein n=1 Tax=unclassified Kitasatospora TaxID=2633591 RepID=UPI0033EEB87B